MRKLKIFILLLLLLSVACSTTSPFKSVTSGNVSEFLKKTPQSAEHPDAGASLLLSDVHVEFFKDGTSTIRTLERYKIFNERGRKYASKSISYREGYQKANLLFANTIKPDGQVISLSSRDVFDASQYAGLDFYTDIKLKRFTMPAIEDGCVVEYAYEVQNIKPVFEFDFSTTFLLRNLFPIEEDTMEIVVPSDKEINYRSYITDMVPQMITDGDKKRYIFTNLKQKAIIPEPRMPSLIDRETFPQVWVWTMKDWKAISSWYIRLVSEQMKTSPELETFTRQLIAGKKTDKEKISAIFNFVSQNVRYIAILLGPHTHTPHAASEIFKKRYGDCKDKTVLLLTMLKIAGISGMPALVPIDREFFNKDMPSLSTFNHVIAVVPDGKSYLWLDATNEVAAYDSIPFTRPTTVFLISPDGSYSFVETPHADDQKDFIRSNTTFHIQKEGHASVDFIYEYHGKAAEALRYAYKYLPPEQRKKSFEKIGIEVNTLDMSGFADTGNPFVIRLKGHFNNMVQVIDSNMMILSNVVRLETYRDITAAATRQYPVVLKPSFRSSETIRYVFPEGFKARRIPETFVSDKPFNIRHEEFSMNGSTLEVKVEKSSRESKLISSDIDQFRNYALELQKHESSLKNIIFERK